MAEHPKDPTPAQRPESKKAVRPRAACITSKTFLFFAQGMSRRL